jgi:hypothetical protein
MLLDDEEDDGYDASSVSSSPFVSENLSSSVNSRSSNRKNFYYNKTGVRKREPTMKPSLIDNAGLHQMETFVFNNTNQNQLKVSVNFFRSYFYSKDKDTKRVTNLPQILIVIRTKKNEHDLPKDTVSV